MLQWFKNLFKPPEPAGPPRRLRQFDLDATPIAQDSIRREDDAWLVEADDTRTVRLFEMNPGEVENGMLTYRAELRSENVQKQGYLEMWCQLPGQGEFFSRGLHNAIKGSNDWSTSEIPFYLKKTQRPDLLRLNLVIEGGGRVWMRNIEVSFTPFK